MRLDTRASTYELQDVLCVFVYPGGRYMCGFKELSPSLDGGLDCYKVQIATNYHVALVIVLSGSGA